MCSPGDPNFAIGPEKNRCRPTLVMTLRQLKKKLHYYFQQLRIHRSQMPRTSHNLLSRQGGQVLVPAFRQGISTKFGMALFSVEQEQQLIKTTHTQKMGKQTGTLKTLLHELAICRRVVFEHIIHQIPKNAQSSEGTLFFSLMLS